MFSRIYFLNHKYSTIIFHNVQFFPFLCGHSRLVHNFKFPNYDSPLISQNRYLTLPNSQSAPSADWNEVLTKWYKKYQDIAGITEILEAQEKVTLLTNQLFTIQSKRRQLQKDVDSLHQQLLETHQKITKSEQYSENHYFLFEKARDLSTKLKDAQNQSSQAEEEERILFTHLSAAIQFCHEKERTHSDNAKYWSLLISFISAALASLITSINNWVRIKEIKEHVSSLHKTNIDKLDHLNSAISNFLLKQISLNSATGNGENHVHLNTIWRTIPEDANKQAQSLEENSVEALSTEDKDTSGTVSVVQNDLSNVKITLALITSALLGSLVTIYLGGSIGGTS